MAVEITAVLSVYEPHTLAGKAAAMPGRYHSVLNAEATETAAYMDITAPDLPGALFVWTITCSGGEARVRFDAPVTTTTGRRLTDGQTSEFIAEPGQRPSIILDPNPLTGTDRSGSINTGGTAQQLAAANTSRRALTGQNISTADLWINEMGGTAAIDTPGSYKVPAGATFSVATNRAISVVGATTGQEFTATEV